MPAAAIPGPQRAVGVDVLLQLPQSSEPGPDRSGLRQYSLTPAIGHNVKRFCMASHELEYEILGSSAQSVEIILDPGETVIAEAGAMNYMRSAERRGGKVCS